VKAAGIVSICQRTFDGTVFAEKFAIGLSCELASRLKHSMAMKIISRHAIVLGLLLCSTAAAQTRRPSSSPPGTDQTRVGSIKARVVLENGNSVSYAVQVTLSNSRGTQARLYSDNQGQFEIRSLPPGEYSLQVEGDRLVYEMISERVDVLAGTPTVITLTLKEKTANGTARPSGSVASVSELTRDVPAKARKEFERASKSAHEGKTDEAIEHLRRAIQEYPSFVMAHNDLGVQLLTQEKLDEAAGEFRRALQIDPKAFNPNLNLGLVLVRQQRYEEAVQILRTAVALESTAPAAHLYLGLALKGSGDLEGAEAELKSVYAGGGEASAIALFHLGDLYLKRGNRALARDAFELYLRQSPTGPYAAQARQLIVRLGR
jgi:tetratricopeptide (TPR) repeat protein